MAAKVVMVAVPTVLGIASIRVYTVSEAPADGLLKREKLNIYTPLPESAQTQFVSEKPGVIESGVTTVRESILPFAVAVKRAIPRAAKVVCKYKFANDKVQESDRKYQLYILRSFWQFDNGACVSVKRESINLYHTGQDVYYYLKDPPPGFLPRFGTITMAGLLGMFLARRGSRFKRFAIPLGLMSAGASVCYPAQTVAVIKVMSRKVYAAGQWSSAVVSSMLSPKPQELDTKAMTPSQPQSAAWSSQDGAVIAAPEVSSLQSGTIPETEEEPAKSFPVSDEPTAAVTTKEASSVTLTESSPDQVPTESNTVQSVAAEPKAAPPSKELTVPVENKEPSNTKQAPENVSNEGSPVESTVSPEPEKVEASPVQSATVESTLSTEEPPAPETSAVPALESAKTESTSLLELVDQPPIAAVDETPTATLTHPPSAAAPAPEQPLAENSKGGSDFNQDPSLMDFGQSSPEDEDLYSKRS